MIDIPNQSSSEQNYLTMNFTLRTNRNLKHKTAREYVWNISHISQYNTTEKCTYEMWARKKGINLKRKRKNKATHVVLCAILYGKNFGWSFRSFLFRKFALVCNYFIHIYMYEERILLFSCFLQIVWLEKRRNITSFNC